MMTILNQEDKLLIVHRRLFEGDVSRYFIGEVDASNDILVQVTGYTWVNSALKTSFFKKEEARTKIFSLSSGTFIVYKLKRDLDMKSIEITVKDDTRTILQDKNGEVMDITERHHHLPTA